MSTIAIDFGTGRTKVATYDSVSGKPVLIELGREIRSIIPSLVYIPAEGPVLVGDDAQEEIVSDPAGAVRGLKKEIHKQDAILRNGRKFSPGDLLTALFARIKQDCQQFYFQGEEVTDCCLTVPVKFDQHQRDCISQAASRAGFKNINVVEEPVAAAMHWLRQNAKDIQCVVVCDIGAGTTDIAMLRRDGDQLRPHPAIQSSGFNRGGDDIDDSIWDLLQDQNLDSSEQADTTMLQLRKLKERFTRRTIQEDRLKLGKTSVLVPRSVVEECFSQFTQNVLAELRRLAEQMKKEGIDSTPLVLAGGGASIPGLEAAIRNDKWPGEVFHWNDSEYASALGAAGLQKGAEHPNPTISVSEPASSQKSRVAIHNLPFREVLSEATSGNAEAQNELGLRYLSGKGVINNEFEAFKSFQKAAEQEHVPAQFQLGYCYLHGRGVLQNHIEAMKWIKAAAERGHAKAQFTFGQWLSIQPGVAGDITTPNPLIIKWWTLSGEGGCPHASERLADCYRSGWYVAENEMTSTYWGNLAVMQWLQMANERQDAEAQFNVGHAYLGTYGIGGSLLRKCHTVEPNIDEGIRWINLSAEQSYPDALVELANCFEKGVGVGANPIKAFELFKLAAEKDHPMGQRMLGMYYEEGIGTSRNLGHAIAWYRKGKENGNWACESALERLGV